MKRSYIVILVIGVILIIVGVVFLAKPQSSYAPTNGSAPTSSSSGMAPTLPPAISAATNPTLGTYLVASNGMTLYTYSKDTVGVSNCTGPCAAAWPPYYVSAAQANAAGPNITGPVGSIMQSGKLQVTYKGMPLYFWMSDKKPGDTTGQNVNGFSVAKP
jgi:predicted lipoprotein with Yx(FWY)xxD motif